MGVLLLDKGQTIKGTYAHVLDSAKATTVAGEVNYDINQGKKTTIIVGSAPTSASLTCVAKLMCLHLLSRSQLSGGPVDTA